MEILPLTFEELRETASVAEVAVIPLVSDELEALTVSDPLFCVKVPALEFVSEMLCVPAFPAKFSILLSAKLKDVVPRVAEIFLMAEREKIILATPSVMFVPPLNFVCAKVRLEVPLVWLKLPCSVSAFEAPVVFEEERLIFLEIVEVSA